MGKVVISDGRDFKGVWFPKEVWCNSNLSMVEKGLLVEINSLSKNGECYATNQHFADFLGISKSSVSKLIPDLVKRGYLQSTLIYKITEKGKKQIDKRILKLTDPITYTSQIETLYPSANFDIPYCKKGNTPIANNEERSNTLLSNTFKDNSNIDNIERSFTERNNVFSWKSFKDYNKYINNVIPEMIKDICSERTYDMPAEEITEMILYFFAWYNSCTGEYHPPYKKDLLMECIDNWMVFSDYVDSDTIKGMIEVFFEHDNIEGKNLRVFSDPNMLPWLNAELTLQYNQMYY